jgi:heat shock protein HslJ
MTDLGASGPTATSDALAGTQWRLERIAGEALPQPVVVAFGHDGRVSGSTGLNHLTASYSVTAEYLTFGPLATTRRSGSTVELEHEHRVVASLAGMCAFRLTAEVLSFEGPIGTVELVSTSPRLAAEPVPPAEGT